MKISVYGSASGDYKDVLPMAKEVGRQIALSGNVIITGACPGLPYEAVKGFREAKGKGCIGYSPAKDFEEHKSKYNFPEDSADEFIFTGLGKLGRNLESVKNCDACVVVGGRIGTLNEFTNAFGLGKVIGVLVGSGGISNLIDEILKVVEGETDAKVVFDSDPEKLIKKIEGVKNEQN